MVNIPVGKIAEKAVYMSVFLITWHCILSAELTKTFRLFLGDFAHWTWLMFRFCLDRISSER